LIQKINTFGILVGLKGSLVLFFFLDCRTGELRLLHPFLKLDLPGLGMCRAVGIKFIVP
jgi:hypothetical protein